MTARTTLLWITHSAMFIALLVILQALTAPLGNMLITGSIVNLLLIISVKICGLSSGLTVAIISPIMAKLFGIGPLWSLIPFIALGNLSLMLVWHYLGKLTLANSTLLFTLTLVLGALVKFCVLYIGIVRIAIPLLLTLPPAQASTIAAMFSTPQLVTALIGGFTAGLVLPRLEQGRYER